MNRIAKIFLLNLFLATSLFAQDDEYGIASYYSDLFHGKPTASGELYDKTKLTAAHKTLPFGTVVTVTHLGNKKSVQVTVNDRGPFISGRIIELSKAAAQQLDLITEGAARVKVSISKEAEPAVIVTDAKPAETPTEMDEPDKKIETSPVKKETKKSTEEKVASAEKKTEPKVNQKPSGATVKAIEKPTDSKPSAAKSVVVRGVQEFQPYDLYEVELKRPEKKGFGVQVAAMSSQEALFRKISELQGEWFDNILISVEKADDGVLYKIMLGPFPTQDDANVYKKNLKKNKKINGFVVDLAALTKKPEEKK